MKLLAHRPLRIALAALFLSVAGLGAWAFWIEPSSLTVREVPLELPRWPAECAGLRVAVLTDLHVGSPYNDLRRLAQVVERTQAARPDLILILGDLMIDDVAGGRWVAPEAMAPILGRLRAPLGVDGVLGNHDRWFNGARVEAALRSSGIQLLEDASRQLSWHGCRFWLAGIGDAWTTRHRIDRALAGIPDGEPILAFTHNPDLFPQIPARVALTVAGHTHGGQVALPFLGRRVVPSRYGERYAIGLMVERGRRLYVSPGIGTSIVPIRFRVPPEITLLELRALPPAPGPG